MNKNNKRISAIVSVFVAALLLVPAAAVLSNDDVEKIDKKNSNEMTVGELMVLAGQEEYLADVPDDILGMPLGEMDIEPMIFPILAAIAVGIVVGMVIDWAGNKLGGNSNKTAPDPSEAEIKAALRQLRSDIITSNWQNVSQLFIKLINNDAQLLAFTEAYFALQAETAVADLWSETGTFVADRVLTRSTYIVNFSTYKYNVLSAINQFALSMSDERVEIFNAKASTYGSMRMGFSYGSNTWLDQNGLVWTALTDMVIPTADNNRVYIDVIDYPDRLENTNYLYVFGGNGRIVNTTSGTPYTMPAGANDLLAREIPAGWYDLDPGVIYCGNFLPSASLNGLEPSAAMVLFSNGEYGLAYEKSGGITVKRGATTWDDLDDLCLIVTFPDETNTTVTESVRLDGIISSYQLVEEALNSAARNTVKSGQAAWILYDELGTSSSLIKPSSLMSGMQSNTSVTAEQQAAIYAIALKQLAVFGEKVRPENITVSRESLDLVVHGDIFYRGVMVAENAIFTPFCYLDDQSIAVGSHDWQAPGLAMVWATGVPSLQDWNGLMMQYEMIELGEGYQFRINDIVAHGTPVQKLDLTIAGMEYLGLMDFGVPDNAPDWSFSKIPDLTWSLCLNVILVMILMFLVVIPRIPPGPPQKYVALITVIVGAVALLILTGILAMIFGAIKGFFRGLLPW